MLEPLLEKVVELGRLEDDLRQQATIAKLEYDLWGERFDKKLLEEKVEALEARQAAASCSEHVHQPKRLKN